MLLDAPIRLDDPLLAPRLLGRGIYRAPYLALGRPILIAISGAGELLAARRVPESWTMRAAWDAMEAWLEQHDPAPVLRLVDGPDAAARIAGTEPRRLPAPVRVTPRSLLDDVSPYDEPPRRRSALPAPRRRSVERPGPGATKAAWCIWRAHQVHEARLYQRRPLGPVGESA